MTNTKIKLNALINKRFIVATWSIVIIAFVLRFYNYNNRWGLAYDQAHDALVARYALEAWKIPLVGPFSSAGAFQTGGEWYWLIMGATALYPQSLLTPWVILTLLSVVFVFCIIRVGIELAGKQFAIIAGLLSAFSTAQIAQSVNLTNQSPIAFIALLSIWSMIRYVRTRNKIYIFFLFLFPVLAGTIHLQGAALIVLPITVFLFVGVPSLSHLILGGIGAVLPLSPIFLYDIQHNFFNIRNMFQYFFLNNQQITYDALGRRWLTYLGNFWPTELAHMIGGNLLMAYLIIATILLVVIKKIVKRQLSREFWILIISFLLMVTLVRYTRTPLYSSYLMFLHPYVILLISYMVYEILKVNKLIGVIFLCVLIVGSMGKNLREMINVENFTARQVREWKNILYQQYPKDKFAVYDMNYARRDKSLPLVLYLDADKRIDDRGKKIGMTITTSIVPLPYPTIFGENGGYQMYDLTSSSSAELDRAGWAFVNPSAIYKSTEEWQ